MILLNRQRTDENCLQSSSAPTKSPASKFHAVNRASSSHSSPGMSLLAPLRGRSLVVASSEQILDAFVFLYQKIPAALVSWTIAQQAFNACMLLLLDALELRKETTGAISVEKALVIFLAMEKIHKLAPLAIRRISWGLNQLRDITQGNMDSTQTKQEHDPQADKLSLGSEAVHSSNKGYGDTVMGATGMYLLDDPGLQGCAHEAFAPFRWDATVSEPAAFAKLEDEPPIAGTTVDHMREMSNKPFPTERSHQARSLEGVQSRWRSQASHSAPYIDSTSPLSSSQPPTPKPPRSHTSSADSLSQLKYPLHEAAQNDYRPLVTPQWHAQFRPPTRGEPSQRAPVTVSQEAAMRMQHTAMFSGHYPNTTMQQRHNSCPTIPQQFTRPPATSGMAYSPSYLPEVQHGIALGTEASEFMDIPGQNSLPFAQDIVAEDLIDTRTTHPSWSTNATEWPHSSNSHSPPTQSGSIDPFQRMDHSFPH